MGKISLKGSFVFSGTGKIIPSARRIKVLKQLGSDLFICGDRPQPELIYSIPSNAKITYAHIDNQGANLENWVVTVFLKPNSAILDKDVDYNQQTSVEGDEEVVYINKDGVLLSFPLLEPTKTFDDNRIHTGNNNCYQLLDYTEKSIFFKDNENEQEEVLNKPHLDIDIFRNYTVRNFFRALQRATAPNTTGQEYYYFKSPHHKIKGAYSSHVINEENTNKPVFYAFRGIEAQIYQIEEAEHYTTREIYAPPSNLDDRPGNRNVDEMMEFLDECAEPGDRLVLFFANDPGWQVGISTISEARRFPNMCQGAVPPYPTFKASCSALPIPEGKRIWCPTFVGSGYYAPFKIGNFQFESTPIFGGEIYEAPGSKEGYGARFIPDLQSLSSGKLTQVGDTVTSVRARGVLGSMPVLLWTVSFDEAGNDNSGWMPNPNLSDIGSNEKYPLLDMRLFSFSTFSSEIKSSCVRPNIPPEGNGTNEDEPRYVPETYEEERDASKLYEYMKSNLFIGMFNYKKCVVIKFTDSNREPINSEIRDMFLSSHGFSCNPKTRLFFNILPTQKILNEDLLLTKEHSTEWEIEEYLFEAINLYSITQNSESSWNKRVLKEEVLPLKSFDKIWSYSYYSEGLEKDA